LRINFLN